MVNNKRGVILRSISVTYIQFFLERDRDNNTLITVGELRFGMIRFGSSDSQALTENDMKQRLRVSADIEGTHQPLAPIPLPGSGVASVHGRR